MLPSLVLFARAPRPGRVKTRLASVLTEPGAARLYRAFLEDAARAYSSPSEWESVLAADPDPNDPDLAELFPPPWRREAQSAGDLGSRLEVAFAARFAEEIPAVVVVGSDHPDLPRRVLTDAFARLKAGASAVLVPAQDGGYCAIGLPRGARVRGLFDGIRWSTESVLVETLARFTASGIEAELLEPSYDVDRPEDLARLRRDLASRDPADGDYPHATARVLESLA